MEASDDAAGFSDVLVFLSDLLDDQKTGFISFPLYSEAGWHFLWRAETEMSGELWVWDVLAEESVEMKETQFKT